MRAEAVFPRRGYQQVDQRGILQPGAHLFAHELGNLLAHLLVEEHLGKGGQPQLERAVGMDIFQQGAALIGGQVGPAAGKVVFEAAEGGGQDLAQFLEALLVGGDLVGAVGRVLHRQDVLGRAHEDRQMGDLVGDRLDDLDPGRADAHDADPLAGQIDALARPARGVKDPAAEILLPRKAVLERGRQHPRAGDQEARVEALPAIGRDQPAAAVLVEVRRGDGRRKDQVAAQVQPVGDVVQPALDLGLVGETLRPAPALVEILVEQILVDVAFGIKAGAGIAVPEPRSPDIGGGIDGLHRKPVAAQLPKLVKPRHPRPDHQRV